MSICNVLHTTTRCNLDCTYCYEKRNRDMPGFKHHDTTKEEVDNFLKKTKELEPAKTSSIVLFGGEPLLNMDILKYAYEVGSTYSKGSFHYNITSNGILLKDTDFSKQFFDLLKEYKSKGIASSLDISYDFQGNGLRKYVDGRDSTPDVKCAIENVNQYLLENKDAFNFRIRCTIQNLNQDKILQNSIKTFETYTTISRIIYTYAYNNMEEHFGSAYFEQYMAKYKPYLLELAKMYKRQICFQTELCVECGNCTISHDNLKYRYQTPGSSEDTYIIDGKAKEFNLFKNLVEAEDVEGRVKTDDLKKTMKTLREIING